MGANYPSVQIIGGRVGCERVEFTVSANCPRSESWCCKRVTFKPLLRLKT